MQQYILLITYRIISFYIHTSKQFFVVMLYYLTIHTRTKIKKVRYPPTWVRNIWVGHMNRRDVNKDLTPKDQDKDKDLTPKDQDKDKDLTPKDKDKDLTPKDQDKDK